MYAISETEPFWCLFLIKELHFIVRSTLSSSSPYEAVLLGCWEAVHKGIPLSQNELQDVKAEALLFYSVHFGWKIIFFNNRVKYFSWGHYRNNKRIQNLMNTCR